jgi:Flp pilus assembly pilin Flp
MSKVDAFREFLLDEDGTETLEWGIVCFVIVVGAIVAIRAIAPKIKTMWTNVNASVK